MQNLKIPVTVVTGNFFEKSPNRTFELKTSFVYSFFFGKNPKIYGLK
jgi:hypothetical protein